MKPYSLRLYYISSRKYITDLQQHKFLALLPCSLLLTIGVTQFACSDVERGEIVRDVKDGLGRGERSNGEEDSSEHGSIMPGAAGQRIGTA